MNAATKATIEAWSQEAQERLRQHPELAPYVEPGDDGPEAAQRRYDSDAVEARRSLKEAVLQVHRTVTVRGLETTALDVEP